MFSAQKNAAPASGKLFVEDVFSTYLYTGNGSTQTITNGIDLAGKGGMLWIKNRNASSDPLHYLNFNDGSNIVSNNSNNTSAKQVMSPYVAFNSNGFFVNAAPGVLNNSSVNYVSWTFREAPKFFDVVTYTGTGTDPLTLNHNLQSVPGCIIIKCTSAATNWRVHSAALNMTLTLNTTNAGFSPDGLIKNLTSTTFQVNNSADVNTAGATYVAYLFAHDTTSDGIIQCGSFTTDGSGNATVNLGWEPQWLMVKASSDTSNWAIGDVMRGFSQTKFNFLRANTTNAELTSPSNPYTVPTATGFSVADNSGNFFVANTTYIYIAIRRGPMKTPTTGTSVFSPQATTLNTGSNTVVSSGTAGPMDMVINQQRSASGGGGITQSRLTGGNYLITSSTAAETSSSYTNWDRMTDTKPLPWTDGQSVAVWQFKRAPSFFDEVCYTGTGGGTTRTLNHNLGVAPELMIVKSRNDLGVWYVYNATLGNQYNLALQSTNAANNSGNLVWNSTTPSATTFTVGDFSGVNGGGTTYVAYLFASCPGVSKIGTYTGNGSSQTINCGFAAGARFVMIKRTDSTGSWWVWDTARGLVSGNDPALQLNSTAAETTGIDSIDPDSSGFIVNQDATTNINVNGGTYVFLSVA